jgi:hypothetical protein
VPFHPTRGISNKNGRAWDINGLVSNPLERRARARPAQLVRLLLTWLFDRKSVDELVKNNHYSTTEEVIMPVKPSEREEEYFAKL